MSCVPMEDLTLTVTVGSQADVSRTFLMNGSGKWVQPQRHAIFITCRQCLVATSQATSCNTFGWRAGRWSIDEQFDDTSMTCCYPSLGAPVHPMTSKTMLGLHGLMGIVQIACPGWTKKDGSCLTCKCLSQFSIRFKVTCGTVWILAI